MSSRPVFLALAAFGFLLLNVCKPASAQVGRRLGYRAARIEARAQNLVNRIMLRRQGIPSGEQVNPAQVNPAEPSAAPVPQPTPANSVRRPTLAQGPVEPAASSVAPTWAPARPLPNRSQLAALDDSALLEAWRSITSQFHNELDTLSTADGWHRYLGVKENFNSSTASLQSEIRLEEIQELLSRFDRVSVNPKFQKVSRLPSFAANHSALQELVARFSGPQLEDPAVVNSVQQESSDVGAVESLPVPQPVAQEAPVPKGERSILKNR